MGLLTVYRIAPVLLALGLPGCPKKQTAREYPSPPAVVSQAAALPLKAVTFNVRYEEPKDLGTHAWPNRLLGSVRVLRGLDPDVIGVQEALHGQVADLWASLPDYAFQGVGRDDGRRTGEYAGIFYRRSRFALDAADCGTFWLSDTPETPGTKNWGNQFPRIVTWVRLIDRSSGRGVYVFNAHWDHINQPSRERSALLLAKRIDARQHASEPVVLLGDFNATENNNAVAYLRGKSVSLAGQPAAWGRGLIDTFHQQHPQEAARTTLHFWSNSRAGTRKVDHILVSAPCRVKAADIAAAPISDHFPVWAEVVF